MLTQDDTVRGPDKRSKLHRILKRHAYSEIKVGIIIIIIIIMKVYSLILSYLTLQ